jgi:PAS domain S-box-containing protein
LLRLDGIAVYSVADLGREAAVDKEFFRKNGLKSVIFLPMAVGGELVGFLGFDSTTMEMQWTQDAISLLNIVGAIIADALQRKRNEEALRKEAAFTNAVLNSTGALFIVLDDAGRIIQFNAAAEELTGQRFEEVRGMAPWELFFPKEEEARMRKVFKRLTAGAPPSQMEGILLTKSGDHRFISWSNAGLANAAGAVEYVIFSGLDMTERKRLEADVLDVAEREQSRFGHDLHDGLGQHLTGIEFMAQVLQQQLESAGRPEAAHAEEITSLIRQAIGHTRDLARGLSPVVLQSKGLPAALADLGETVSKRPGVRCKCMLQPQCDVPRLETATHLYRIAQEAVNNALKHGMATQIDLTLRRDGDRYELCIADNGQGFSQNAARSRGMGLRVMQYRAGILGGSLEIQQERGKGVTILCRCP